MSMGILDFSTSSSTETKNYTTTNTDSYNRSTSTSRVMDNVGNVTVQLADPNATTQKWLPWIIAGAVAVALLR